MGEDNSEDPIAPEEIAEVKGPLLSTEEFRRRMEVIVRITREALGKEREEKEDLLKSYGSAGYGIQAVVIFGSYGRGKPRGKSDLDLLFICDQEGTEGWGSDLQARIKDSLVAQGVPIMPDNNINVINIKDPKEEEALKELLTGKTYYESEPGFRVIGDNPQLEERTKAEIDKILEVKKN